jgi:hypothetical protein
MGDGYAPGSLTKVGDTLDVDDGTGARIESPTPGPVGMDSPSAGGTAAGVADRIVNFAKQNRGKRVGDGECFTLANQALSSAGARTAKDYGTVTRDADYVWGSSVSLADLRPGDVIQMRGYRYDREIEVNNPDGSGSTNSDFQERPHHTVIVESVGANGAVTVLEQNAPRGSSVTRSQLFFSSGTTTEGRRKTTITVQGTLWFYRPQAQ